MSASLVGSEMCIRDRSRTAWAAGRPALLPPTARHPSGGRLGRAPKRLCSCLLYTSDAADDM
eukprot:14834572-Alexandrium_andersonii.AAC.1